MKCCDDVIFEPGFSRSLFCMVSAFKELSKRPRNTTSELQLDELCTLVETLNNWTVIDRVSYVNLLLEFILTGVGQSEPPC